MRKRHAASICGRRSEEAIEFYKNAFGAGVEGGRGLPGPDGRIMHAQLRILATRP